LLRPRAGRSSDCDHDRQYDSHEDSVQHQNFLRPNLTVLDEPTFPGKARESAPTTDEHSH
jgi:hypothetical protein